MRRLFRRLSDRLVDDVSRRAIEETLADGAHARQQGRRVASRLHTAAALARILSTTVLTWRWSGIVRHAGADTRIAFRRLRATPGATALAITTLAAGIGVTTAVYAAVYATLLRPPGIVHLDRAVEVRHTARPGGGMSWPDVRDIGAAQTVFDRVGGFLMWYGAAVATGQSQAVSAEVVTGDYFEILGIAPERGRLIQGADDRATAPPVAVLSHRLWTALFARDANAVGQVIKLNDQPFVVAGIAPASYRGGRSNASLGGTDLWVALGSVEHLPGFDDLMNRENREQRRTTMKARLAPGRTVEDARAEMARIAAQLDATAPIGKPDARGIHRQTRQAWTIVPARDAGLREFPETLRLARIASGALVVVMLVVCANLVNVTLARMGSRRQESVVRRALGASGWRLLREALIESALLAIAGGALGLLVAQVLVSVLPWDLRLHSTFVMSLEPRLDPAVVAAAAGATAFALLLSAVVSARASLQTDLRSATSAHGVAGATLRWRGRKALIATQVTLSVALVLLAVTSARRAAAVVTEDVGIDFSRLAVLSARTTPKYDPARLQVLVADVAGEIRRRPDVDAVSVTTGVRHIDPENGYLERPGRKNMESANLVASDAAIFAVTGARIVRGRVYSEADVEARAPVAVLSEFLARAMYGEVDPIGQSFQLRRQRAVGEPDQITHSLTVIGIVDDRGPDETDDSGDVYVPIGLDYFSSVSVVVRAKGTPSDLMTPLRETMRRRDPEVTITAVGTGLGLGRPEVLQRRVTAAVTAGLGGFALVLALIGLFGVLAHLVRRRVREIGVRIALGATTGRITAGVLREGLGPVLIGLVAGTILGVLTRLISRAVVFDIVPAVDIWAMFLVPLPMLAAGALACYLPARRAARVDPNVALRET